MVPTVDGPVEVTSNESLQRALKRAVPQPENVRAQGTPAEYVGNILTSDNGFGIYPADTSGEIEVYNSLAKAVVGAFIIDTQAINTGYDTGTITYRYYPPSLDQGLSLSTFITNDITSEYSVSDSSVVRAGDPVEVQVNYVYVTDYPGGVLNRVYNGTISLNGEVVFTFENVRSTGDSEFLPVTPCFASKESGEARLELIGNRGDERQSDFIQKGLEFRQETQDFELQPNQTASIRNDFGWDLGANPDSLVQPGWEVEIVDPQKQVIKTFSGSGRQMSANWTPDGLSSPIRLVPMDRFSQDGEVPVYGYRLKAKAKIGDPVFGAGSIFYELTNDREEGELQFVNIKLDPDPPFQNEGDSVDLTAEVIALGLGDLTDDDIEWWVDLLTPSGEVVGDPLATGNGFEVSATWNGQVDGVAVDDPGAYTLRIKARRVCDGGASPRRASLRAQAVGCGLVAQATVGLAGPRMVANAMVVTNLGGTRTETQKDVGVGFLPAVLGPSGSQAFQNLRRDLLGSVHSIKDENGAYKVTLTVVADFPGETPAKLRLQARNMITGAILADERLDAVVEDAEEGRLVFKTPPVELPRDFVDADPGGTPSATRYSIGELYRDKSKLEGGKLLPGAFGVSGVSNGVTEAFMNLVDTSPGAFPAPVFIGKFAETAIDAKTLSEIYPEPTTGGATGPLAPPLTVAPGTTDPALRLLKTVTSDPNNLLTTGFVPIEFTIQQVPENKNPSTLTPVYVKVPRFPATTPRPAPPAPPTRGANVVLWTFHGSHDGSLGASEDRNRVTASSTPKWSISPVTPGIKENLESVHTLIITSCEALDINDYNNGELFTVNNVPIPGTEIPGPRTPIPGVNQRTHGGELWDRVMATTTKQVGRDIVLLGYNDVSPLIRIENGKPINSMAEIIELFDQELDNYAGRPEQRQFAWMAANVNFAATTSGTGSPDAKWVALHATAIDKDYYYYIPQFKDRTQGAGDILTGATATFITRLGSVKRTHPVYRVARNPVRPPGARPTPLPVGAQPEWGVYAPGVVDLKWEYNLNRDNFAEQVDIPNLTFPLGQD